MSPTKTAPTKKSIKIKFNIGVVSAITELGNSSLLCTAMEAMCALGFGVAVLAEGDASAQELCFKCAENFPKQFSMLESLSDNHLAILKKSDVIVFAARPEKKELKAVLAAGVVPVLPEGCGLENFDAQKETGSAFTFEENNIWSLVAALVRASENRKFSWDWKMVQQHLEEVYYQDFLSKKK